MRRVSVISVTRRNGCPIPNRMTTTAVLDEPAKGGTEPASKKPKPSGDSPKPHGDPLKDDLKDKR